MEKFNLEVVREDKIKVELDPEYFNEKWFEDFRKYFYDLYTLEELSEHIAYNVVENGLYFIEGIGTPLRDGATPTWASKEDLKHLITQANVIYNKYDTKCETNII